MNNMAVQDSARAHHVRSVREAIRRAWIHGYLSVKRGNTIIDPAQLLPTGM